jgi:hypothetical protein
VQVLLVCILFNFYYCIVYAYTVSAIAVGRDVFRADANTLIDLLLRIQS